MTRHLIRFSLRALRRQGAYVAINILGLAIGIACSLIISLFIIHELSYDKYHQDHERIYRIGLYGKFSGQEVRAAYTPAPMGPAMLEDFPEVESFLRMNIWDETVIQWGDEFFHEHNYVEADSAFFDFFSIPLIKGNKKTALNEPYTLVLTETVASKIFGDTDPVGEMVSVGSYPNSFRVTGVMEDVPETTHFDAGIVGSFASNPRYNETTWTSNSFFTYIKLHPEADPQSVIDGFEHLLITYVGPELYEYMGITVEDFLAQGNAYSYFLQPLAGIHLDPSVEQHQKPANDPRYLWIFGIVGFLILVIASINFMNLSTAQATKRAKEVGMKKVIGSTKGMLVWQFITETVILTTISLIFAIIIAEFALPYINNLLSLALSLDYLGKWYVIPGMIVIVLTIGFFAGSYPAFYLSAFNPASVLKGKTGNGRQNTGMRQALTVMQFAISIMLITGSAIMYRQINFMMGKDLGFDKENVLVLRRADVIGDQIDTFKNELLSLPGVQSVSASTAIPGRTNNNNGYMIRGREEESFLMQTFWVDYDYLETYGIELAEGRFFDPDLQTDQEASILNESAVRNYRLDDPFATRIVSPGLGNRIIPVIGIVNDYHFESLHNNIAPSILLFKDDETNWGYISIRIEPGMTRRVVEQTEHLWHSFASSSPMLYFFMDEDFERFYREERQNAQLSVLFTILAIIIASMGLYGLTAFSLQQRIREIGIRRTFGASVASVWYIICKDVMILVGISTVLAWPLVYWAAGNWLQNFQYRISLNISEFLLGFFFAIIIALATISYRVIRTASINPSISLRYE